MARVNLARALCNGGDLKHLLVRTRTTASLFLLLYLAALVVDAWLVFVLPEGSWQDHVGLLLGVIGIFAFAIGFLNATELAKELPPPVFASVSKVSPLQTA